MESSIRCDEIIINKKYSQVSSSTVSPTESINETRTKISNKKFEKKLLANISNVNKKIILSIYSDHIFHFKIF